MKEKINKQLLFIESLRGVFALFIVFYHLRHTINIKLINNFFFLKADIFVDYFFIISGFIIFYKYHKKINTFTDLIKFQLKRFIRLYPLHIITLLFFLLIELSKFFFLIKTGIQSDSNSVFERNNLLSFIHNIFLTHGFLNFNSYNEPSWSISIEFYSYLIFGLLLLFFSKLKKILNYYFCLAVLACISCLSFFFINKYNAYQITHSHSYLRCLFSFSLGACIFYFNTIYKTKINNSFSNIINFLIIILIIYNTQNQDNFLVLILLFIVFFFVNLNNKNCFFNKFLQNRVLVFLGSISYGIYMFHYLMIWISRQIFRFYFNAEIITSSNNYSNIKPNILESTIILFFVLSSTILISYFSKIYFEKFFLKLNKKINLT
jgi:peptidoglycan/LPS O-acetylase OafA/YrhL